MSCYDNGQKLADCDGPGSGPWRADARRANRQASKKWTAGADGRSPLGLPKVRVIKLSMKKKKKTKEEGAEGAAAAAPAAGAAGGKAPAAAAAKAPAAKAGAKK